MAPVLWVLAVLSTITVIHRIRFTYVQSTAQEAAKRQTASVS
jgi:CDP-diacylglycerol--glycerol-3-phosphate 3-phosphatidyltransferase